MHCCVSVCSNAKPPAVVCNLVVQCACVGGRAATGQGLVRALDIWDRPISVAGSAPSTTAARGVVAAQRGRVRIHRRNIIGSSLHTRPEDWYNDADVGCTGRCQHHSSALPGPQQAANPFHHGGPAQVAVGSLTNVERFASKAKPHRRVALLTPAIPPNMSRKNGRSWSLPFCNTPGFRRTYQAGGK